MDYKKIGFKCGIEIHNRLNTKTKLFCNCKPRFSEDKPITIIKRKLRAVAGELGQVDIAAMYEYLRDRTFFYQCYPEETCLICIDEEPPKSISKEALEVALQVAKFLRADIPDEIHVMRKTVIDGSNTCAFQRTAIVGLNGVLKTSQGNVGISNICLEEESAGIVNQEGNEITYRLDRLGIPLIEIGTAPDIKNPEHAKEVAKKLGRIIRSTDKSQRGIGATRQDVNVSIKGVERVEIKGVQDLDSLPKIIDIEIERQQEILKKRKLTKEKQFFPSLQNLASTRVVKADCTTEFTRPLPGGDRLYPETDLESIIITKQLLSKIKVPESWEKKAKRFRKMLPEDMVDQILESEHLDIFEDLSKKYNPVLVASTLASTTVCLRRMGLDADFSKEQYNDVFSSVKNKTVSKEAISDILEIVAKNKVSVKDAIKKIGIKGMTEDELRKIVKKVIKKHPNLTEQKRFSPLMGEVMKKVRGRISGKTVAKVLKEELK